MRPEFVSIEATSADDLAMIRGCGDTRFQVINQWTHPFTVCPNPAREGSYVDLRFTHEMSGLFGRDLDPAKWIDFTATMSRSLDWYRLHKKTPTWRSDGSTSMPRQRKHCGSRNPVHYVHEESMDQPHNTVAIGAPVSRQARRRD